MKVNIKRRENPFTQIDRCILQDKRLSYKARGIAAYLFSHGVEWTPRMADLIENSPDGKRAIQSGMKELQKYGYAELKPVFDDNNQLKGKEWVVSEIPDEAVLSTSAKCDRRKTGPTNNKESISKDIDSQVENLTPPPKEEKYASAITQAVEYLNEKAERGFSAKRKSTQKHLRARMKEGYSLDDIKRVIDYKVAKWKDDAKMKEYLRPDTLFAGKFESYLEAAKANSEASVDQYPDDFPQRWVAIHQSYLKKSRMIYRRVAESECRLLSGPEHKSLWQSKPMWWEKQVFADYLKKKHAELNEDPFLLRRYSTVYDYILDKLSEKAQTVGKLTPMVSVLQKVS
jgi:uncharacterized phage protein (TIGR02220 family)